MVFRAQRTDCYEQSKNYSVNINGDSNESMTDFAARMLDMNKPTAGRTATMAVAA